MSRRAKTVKNSQDRKLNVTILVEHHFRRILKFIDRTDILQSLVTYCNNTTNNRI